MKSILGMTALAALMMGPAVATVQADEVNGPWPRDGAQLLLAEGGSDRLADFFLRRESLAENRSSRDSGERFVQMVEEQPTAAGPEREQQTQRSEKSEPGILRDRALYGPH
ncbi:hypothetical protein PSCT_04336 [Pseudomonas sp. SCT]|uniref:hypothetical protein n=1 Tax=Pseudomonas sp. (strain SCT) TaxID=412955 RepID=UPI000EBA714F|nr:hypothetical protein [Pseudomonas sp. SCT]GCA58116.1 hypothetical protein PSCT_04336 [Pseudomonas sp. SCT]